MCGIVGLFGKKKIEEHQINACSLALDKLQHRGPNHRAIYKNKNLILGHTRLSIIDTSEAGHQPMSSSSEKNIIVYNGEFYNYKDERKQLEEKGYLFKSHSDTEVLLSMYEAYGNDFIKRVNGCFALAI